MRIVISIAVAFKQGIKRKSSHASSCLHPSVSICQDHSQDRKSRQKCVSISFSFDLLSLAFLATLTRTTTLRGAHTLSHSKTNDHLYVTRTDEQAIRTAENSWAYSSAPFHRPSCKFTTTWDPDVNRPQNKLNTQETKRPAITTFLKSYTSLFRSSRSLIPNEPNYTGCNWNSLRYRCHLSTEMSHSAGEDIWTLLQTHFTPDQNKSS